MTNNILEELSKNNLEFEVRNEDPLDVWGGVSAVEGVFKAYQYAFSLKELDGEWEITLPFGQERKNFCFKSYPEAIEKIMSHYDLLRREGIIED